jgi:hypothetical protein
LWEGGHRVDLKICEEVTDRAGAERHEVLTCTSPNPMGYEGGVFVAINTKAIPELSTVHGAI